MHLVLHFDCLAETEVVMALLQRVEVDLFIVLHKGILGGPVHRLGLDWASRVAGQG